MNKIKVVHVDDSQNELQTLALLMEKITGAELVSQFNDADEAAKYILNNKVDLAILDIEMADKNGFWLADKIKDTNTLIIFLSSHSEYTLKAFEACALHFLLKPTSVIALTEAIDRVNKFKFQNESIQFQKEKIDEIIKNYLNVESYPKRIFIYNLHKTSIINLDELLYLTSDGAYTRFKDTSGNEFKSSKILKIYDETLCKHPDFIRVHRGYIINKKFVKSLHQENHLLKIELIDGTIVPVSPRMNDKIYKILQYN